LGAPAPANAWSPGREELLRGHLSGTGGNS
jgi:hypothetical protein